MTRPKRYWDTDQYARKLAQTERRLLRDTEPNPGTFTICPCHGRLLCWYPWAGLLKGKP